MTRQKDVYKFVFEEDGKLYSYWAVNDAQCVYTVGEVTRPPYYLAGAGYGLCAFESLEAALEWGAHDDRVYLFKAKATGVTKKLPAMLSDREYMYGTVAPCQGEYALSWPVGTVMCDTIELLEKIPQEA